MEWVDQGIILKINKFSDNSAIVTCLCKNKGIYTSIVKSALIPKNRYIYQVGNLVEVKWQARLEEHMGVFKLDLISSYGNKVIFDKLKLTSILALSELLSDILLKHNPVPYIYEDLIELCELMLKQEDVYQNYWKIKYILFELELIKETGFGLDLTECASTGQKENLVFISPKSGRAVSYEAGEIYKDKLFTIPYFMKDLDNSDYLIDENDTNINKEICEGIKITGYFLEKYHFAPANKKLPVSRIKLRDYFCSY